MINSMFASRSKASVAHLRGLLANTKKENKMRGFSTELVTAGHTIDDEELVVFILNGLEEDYNDLVAAVNVMQKAVRWVSFTACSPPTT